MLALDFDHVIPGHGPVTDRAGLVAFQGFMRQLAAVGEEAARSGRSLEDTQANAALTADAGYRETAIPFVFRLDRKFVVQRAWQEATGNFTPVEAGRRPVKPAELFSVAGKVALVTGGSRGIGLMIARGFAEGGARVYVSSRKAADCEKAAAELSKQGSCVALPADLSTDAECRRLADELGAREPAAARAGEQRRQQLGRALRRVSGRGLRQGAGAQREGDLQPDARADPAPRRPRRARAIRRASSTSARSTASRCRRSRPTPTLPARPRRTT